MNFSDFRKRLGADPWRREPESRRAGQDERKHSQAIEEAEAFERKLQATLIVPVDSTWLEDWAETSQTPRSSNPPRWLAVAASVLIVTGLVAVVWQQTRPPRDVQQYVIEHLAHDGQELFDRAGAPVSETQIADVLARFGVAADQPLSGRVRLIKYCPTPDGRGAHMVVDTGAGNVHLIFMPKTGVIDGREFSVGAMRAHLVALDSGSAIIVGGQEQPLLQVDRWVRQSINPVPTRA